MDQLSSSRSCKLPDELAVSFSTLSVEEPEPATMSGESASTIYMPIVSPPTPAPSPRPIIATLGQNISDPAHLSKHEFSTLRFAGGKAREQYLASILAECSPSELLFVLTTITTLMKHDFLKELPMELAIHIIGYIDDAQTLARASCVSKFWNALLRDERTWKRMCEIERFDNRVYPRVRSSRSEPEPAEVHIAEGNTPVLVDKITDASLVELPPESEFSTIPAPPSTFSHREHFYYSTQTMVNWRKGGRLLNKHRPPSATPDGGTVTSVAMDNDWIVVGLASCRLQVFSAHTGVLKRTLVGHEAGVWAVNLVSAGGYLAEPPPPTLATDLAPANVSTNQAASGSNEDAAMGSSTDIGWRLWIAETINKFGEGGTAPTFSREIEYHIPDSLRTAIGLKHPSSSSPRPYVPKQSDICCASEGWGNANALVISGGCDKHLRVWDVNSGYCIYVLVGHSSTIRCMRVLHNRPIAVTGSRDKTVRVWDVQRGRLLRTLNGHEGSVRCIDVFGNRAVSGSYDTTCRLWDIDTGECLAVLEGHIHQIYCIAYDGKHIASGGLDTSVRVWDPTDGRCIAVLQGHSALVCQLHLTGSMLATGGSDGRVITFSLASTCSNTPNTPLAALGGAYEQSSMQTERRIAAHDSSVTSLQLDDHWLVSGGNDGCVRLYDARTAEHVRELTAPSEAVWKVAHKNDKFVVMCKRAGKTVMEIWSFRPSEEDD